MCPKFVILHSFLRTGLLIVAFMGEKKKVMMQTNVYQLCIRNTPFITLNFVLLVMFLIHIFSH